MVAKLNFINTFISNMDFQFILSLVAAVFIGGIAGYLGSLMITKRMALVGGALGHLALPGVALALVYNFSVFLGALLSIMIGAVVIWYLKVLTRLSMETLTGVVFATGVAGGFLILPISDAERVLIGDITRINLVDSLLAVILGIIIFVVIKRIYSGIVLSEISRDLAQSEGVNVAKYNFIYLVAIALAVSLEVKIVGILLTAALLVIPAAASRNFSGKLKQYSFIALTIGVISAILGILFFKIFNLPAGPLIILAGFFVFLISLLKKLYYDKKTV